MLQQSYRQFGHHRQAHLQAGNGRIDGKSNGVLFLLGSRRGWDQTHFGVEGKMTKCVGMNEGGKND